MEYIKLYEEFSPSFSQRLEKAFSELEEIVSEYEVPEFNVGKSPEVSGIKGIYQIVKSAPSDLLTWCKKIYSENKEKVDSISNEFKMGMVNEEICILTLISIGLLCYFVWQRWGNDIKKKLWMGGWNGVGGYKKDYIDKMKPSEGMQKVKREYRDMNPEELQKELNKELDKGNMNKVKEISKYL